MYSFTLVLTKHASATFNLPHFFLSFFGWMKDPAQADHVYKGQQANRSWSKYGRWTIECLPPEHHSYIEEWKESNCALFLISYKQKADNLSIATGATATVQRHKYLVQYLHVSVCCNSNISCIICAQGVKCLQIKMEPMEGKFENCENS